MKHQPRLLAYLSLFVVAVTLAVVGIAQSCPSFEDGYLIQGCGHDMAASSISGHATYWLMISAAVAAIGLVITLWRDRRPTLGSVLIWVSAGVLELAIPASLYVTPNPFLNVLLLSSSALAVLLAVPAGVSIARDPREPRSTFKAGSVEG